MRSRVLPVLHVLHVLGLMPMFFCVTYLLPIVASASAACSSTVPKRRGR